ncbi:MAG: hypothetical protein R6V54_03030 [Desulfobacteraceae bacterium]
MLTDARDAREMVLEALDARFSKNVPEDVYKKHTGLEQQDSAEKTALIRSPTP